MLCYHQLYSKNISISLKQEKKQAGQTVIVMNTSITIFTSANTSTTKIQITQNPNLNINHVVY